MDHGETETYKIQSIPGAGRGVVATRFITADTLLLQSRRPAAYVLNWQYRKEVCAHCFYYNLGRSLPVRSFFGGVVFCTPECRDEWLDEQGELGLAAWTKLYQFVLSKADAITNVHSLPALCEKPAVAEIEAAWSTAAKDAQKRKIQLASKARRKRERLPGVSTEVVDPHILYYFLSGVLLHHRNPERWQQDVLPLAMHDTPYQSPSDLEAHCNSFSQLVSIMPMELQPSLTAEICHTLIGVAGHNAFGIHFGNDGEEYIGYALCPEASYFNHSCNPNIAKKRIGASWEFRAQRDLAEGEECCITYLGGDEKELSVTARRARLLLHWGFECMCQRCVEESSKEQEKALQLDAS